MEAVNIIAISTSALVTIVTGILTFVIKGYLSDIKKYRNEREKREQAKDELVLGMARSMLLEQYRKCEEKGYYSMDDREVYGKLFNAYIAVGGDGIIDQLAPKLRDLPLRPQSRNE